MTYQKHFAFLGYNNKLSELTMVEVINEIRG